MDELEFDKPKLYKELARQEKRALYKEYNTAINPRSKRSKLWLAVVIFATVLGLAGAVLQSIDTALGRKSFLLSTIGFIMYVFWLIIYCINFALMSKRNGAYFKWLKDEKNIIKKQLQ